MARPERRHPRGPRAGSGPWRGDGAVYDVPTDHSKSGWKAAFVVGVDQAVWVTDGSPNGFTSLGGRASDGVWGAGQHTGYPWIWVIGRDGATWCNKVKTNDQWSGWYPATNGEC